MDRFISKSFEASSSEGHNSAPIRMYIVARSPDIWVSPAPPAPCRLSDPHLTNDRSKVPYRSFVEAKMASSDRATKAGPKKKKRFFFLDGQIVTCSFLTPIFFCVRTKAARVWTSSNDKARKKNLRNLFFIIKSEKIEKTIG